MAPVRPSLKLMTGPARPKLSLSMVAVASPAVSSELTPTTANTNFNRSCLASVRPSSPSYQQRGPVAPLSPDRHVSPASSVSSYDSHDSVCFPSQPSSPSVLKPCKSSSGVKSILKRRSGRRAAPEKRIMWVPSPTVHCLSPREDDYYADDDNSPASLASEQQKGSRHRLSRESRFERAIARLQEHPSEIFA